MWRSWRGWTIWGERILEHPASLAHFVRSLGGVWTGGWRPGDGGSEGRRASEASAAILGALGGRDAQSGV